MFYRRSRPLVFELSIGAMYGVSNKNLVDINKIFILRYINKIVLKFTM